MEAKFGPKRWSLQQRANSVQTTAALHIASTNRKLSAPTELVIASTIPVDVLATEWTEIYNAKLAGNHITGHFRENTITKWQQRWNDEEGGQRDLCRT